MPGLTKKIFLALKQTCQAIAGLAKYLFNSCGFNYVLLGKIQSDTIEKRFGHIRQLSGANYYISMRQLLESDRKLRTLSLLKYSRISVKEIDQAAKEAHNPELKEGVTAKSESLYNNLQFKIAPTENDLAVIYYVTGYCCKSLVRSNRCDQCKQATMANINSSDFFIPKNAKEFFNAINRGGLWKPTPELFNVRCLCWTIFAELCQEQMRETFLNGLNQREVFNEIMSMAFYEGKIISPSSVSVMCNKGHNILEGIFIRFFNCMGKNLLREMNELAATKAVKKIRKMTGKNATN